jgi:hypothetical protein
MKIPVLDSAESRLQHGALLDDVPVGNPDRGGGTGWGAICGGRQRARDKYVRHVLVEAGVLICDRGLASR